MYASQPGYQTFAEETLVVPKALNPSWHRLLRNFTTLAAGETAARLAGLAAIVVMARRLGPGAFGVAILGTTLVNWFRLVVDSGTEVLGVRDISRSPNQFRELAEPILGLRLALSLVAAALFAVAAVLVAATPADRDALLLFALVLPVVGMNLRWMVLGVEAARSVAFGNVAGQLLLVAGVVLLLRDRHDLSLVPVLVAVAELAYAAVVLGRVIHRFGLIRPRVDLAAWRRTLSEGMPLAINGIARTVMYSFDLLLIAVVLTRNDVGLYGAAYKPVLFSSTVVGLLSISFLSAYSAQVETEDRKMLARRTLAAAALVTVPGALALSLGSGLVMALFYGPDYANGAVPLAILAWTIPLLALAAPYANILISANRQATLMRHNLAGAALNISANLAAVPLAGLRGAASVTLASLALVLVLNYRSVVRLGLSEPLPTRRRRETGPAQPLPTSSWGGNGG